MIKLIKIYRGVEQLVARWAHNPKVAGSSPAPATSKSLAHCAGFFYGQILSLLKNLDSKTHDEHSESGFSK
jgi:hypothetical protein